MERFFARRCHNILDILEGFVYDLGYTAFMLWLGVGILRLWRGARIAALVFCWFTFTVVGLILVSWCFWPQAFNVFKFATIIGAGVLNSWFYCVFRRKDVLALFDPVAA